MLGMKHFPRCRSPAASPCTRGDIAEMQTGEGKTLVATLPAYLNALTGEGVHIVTVNDYLAKRDSEWMGKLYRWLGLSVGLIVQGMDGDARRAAYAADITYGTNNEFGFDYLRDNMVTYKANMVQRGHAYAIVDEVDSILIDEARTPLIISGRGEDSSSLYTQVDRFVRTLRKSVVVELEDKVVDRRAGRRRLRRGRKAQDLHPDGQRHQESGSLLQGREPCRRREHDPGPPHRSGHQGLRRDAAGHRLRGQGWSRSSSWMSSPAV